MTRSLVCALAGALLGAVAAALLWWPLLALFALGFARAPFVSSPLGVVALAALPALGLIHGAIFGFLRGRLDGRVIMEVLAAPYAWIMTAGEGLIGGLVMVLSLVPGACVGMLAGLFVAGTRVGETTWPAEAGVGAIVGATLSLLGLNLYVQWPTLRRPR